MYNYKSQSAGGRVMAIRQKQEALIRYYENPNICKQCCNIILVPDNTRVSDTRVKKFCNRKCASIFNNHKRAKPKIIIKKARQCNLRLNITKQELFDRRANYQSARSCIRNNASKVFYSKNKYPKCSVCGYDKHIEVAHIKSVSSFSGNALIYEINDISNLIGLCPNHHWEFDNGLLDIDFNAVMEQERLVSLIN